MNVIAALSSGALVAPATDAVGVVDGDVAVGASVVRAEGLAALVDLADVAIARHLPGTGDGREAVGASDGVAVQGVVVVKLAPSDCRHDTG